MNEERLTQIAGTIVEMVLSHTEMGDSHESVVEDVADRLRLAIKESSQEKDEVIRKLVDSVDDPHKLLRALNTLG